MRALCCCCGVAGPCAHFWDPPSGTGHYPLLSLSLPGPRCSSFLPATTTPAPGGLSAPSQPRPGPQTPPRPSHGCLSPHVVCMGVGNSGRLCFAALRRSAGWVTRQLRKRKETCVISPGTVTFKKINTIYLYCGLVFVMKKSPEIEAK